MHKKLILPVICCTLSIPTAMAVGNSSNPSSKPGNTSSTSTSSNAANPSNTTSSPAMYTSQAKNDQTKISAFQIILRDHDYIVQLMTELNRGLTANVKIEESRAKFDTLKDFIVKHETMEQKVWYPELKKYEALKPTIDALLKEEDAAGSAIKKIDGIKDNTEWVSKVREFMQAVAHHASEEETKLFPKVKAEVKPAELETISDKLREYQAKNNMNR